jgi:hypothetical protein
MISGKVSFSFNEGKRNCLNNMTRLNKYHFLTKIFLSSKFPIYYDYQLPNLKSIEFTAGHFRYNKFYVEHSLIFFGLVGQAPILSIFIHGKKRRVTTTISSNINGKNIFLLLDKFVNIFLPLLRSKLVTSKMKKSDSLFFGYSWRLRGYFDDYGGDLSQFVSDRVEAKEVFMPLTVNYNLSKTTFHAYNESYLRMLRLPFIFFKRVQP